MLTEATSVSLSIAVNGQLTCRLRMPNTFEEGQVGLLKGVAPVLVFETTFV